MNHPRTERREFLRNFGRGALLTGLGALTGLLVWRRWRAGKCTDGTGCGGCAAARICPLRPGAGRKVKS